MKKFFRKIATQCVGFTIKWLSKLELWINRHNNPNPNRYEDLTPTTNADEDGKYSEALAWALKNENIKNIAISGAFGSGKSSVLRTFEKNNRGYKYLNVSLASFLANTKSDDVQKLPTPPNGELPKPAAENQGKNSQLIEQGILQHIIYQVKHSQTPDSRFNRIEYLKNYSLYFKAFMLIAWVLALTSVIEHFFLKQETIEEVLKISYFIWLPTIITFAGIVIFLARLIRFANKSKLKKLSIQSTEIELHEKTDSSILNKHLDEILYFFEATDYDVVVFEDLDRFDNSDVFTKLREINVLINKSEQIGRRVVFIYAIRDDMFLDNSRTKFFDFMIPVIPIINPTNSGDVLHNKLVQEVDGGFLSLKFIDAISLYIDDMRLLKNIYNEYIIYKQKLQSGLNMETASSLDCEKLLAMIIYKNIYPVDFVDLHNQKGKVFDVFKSKPALIQSKISGIEAEILEVNQEIDNRESVYLKDIQELRAVYIEKIIEEIPAALSLRINGESCSFADCKTDENFTILSQENRIGYYHHQANHNTLNTKHNTSGLSFKDIERKVDSTTSYQKREHLLGKRLEQLKKTVERLKLTQNDIQSWTLQQIAEKIDTANPFEKIKDDKLIIYLIRNGYIDEHYHEYISLFYPGVITKKDRDFRLSVMNRESLPFDFQLTKVENLVNKMRLNEFGYKEVLNSSLVDFLFSNQKKYAKEYQSVLQQLCNKSKESINFIDYHIEKGINIDGFISGLCKEWSTFWDFIVLDSGYSEERKDIYLKLIVKHADIVDIKTLNKNEEISKYLAEKENFLQVFSDTPEIKEVVRELNIKFQKLNLSSSEDFFDFVTEIDPMHSRFADEQILFQFVYQNDFYEINQEMIKTIITTFKRGGFITLDTANYTTIRFSNCSHLIEYIERNLNEYISNVFLTIPENTQESEESIIYLLSETTDIDNCKKIIEKQTARLTNLSAIGELVHTIIEYVVSKSKMAATWENILYYYELKNEVIDDSLTEFLNQEDNYNELAKTKIDKENKPSTANMANAIIIHESITEDSFKHLLLCFHYPYPRLDFESLSARKVSFMISAGYLLLSVELFDYLKENFSPLHIDLLKKYPKGFIESQGNYDLDASDVAALLGASEFYQSEKISIIQYILNYDDKGLIIGSRDLSNAVCNVLAFAPYIDLGFAVLMSLMSFGNSIENRVKILVSQLGVSSFLREEISELLTLLGEPYSEIAINGKRPSLSNHQYNLDLVKKLDDIGYISSFKEKDDKIRVNTKLL